MLVAPTSALIGALGGVWLTNLHSARIESKREIRENRSDARDLILDFLQSGEAWAQRGITSTLSAIAAIKDGRVVTDDPPRSYLDSYNEARLAHAIASAKLRMFVGDDRLQPTVLELKRVMDSVTEVMSPIFALLLDGRVGANDVSSQQVHALFDYFEGYKSELAKFEATAAPLVSVPIRSSD